MTCALPGCPNPPAPYSGRGPRPIYCSRACRFRAYSLTPEGKAARKRAMAKKRADYQSRGLCVDCAQPRNGIRYCDACRARRNRVVRETLAAKKLAARNLP